MAALPHLLAGGIIRPDQRIVCILSGAGFKDTHLAKDRAAAISQQPTLPFDRDAITAAILGLR